MRLQQIMDSVCRAGLLGLVCAAATATASLPGPLPGRQQPLGGTYGPKRQSPFDNGFRALAADTLARWHVPGVAIAVVDGDETWSAGFGLAAFPDTPVSGDTLFYTASTTKAFVAATLSLLMGNGSSLGPALPALDWTTPLAAILGDDFVLPDAWATAHLTVDDALAHRTGLAGHDGTRSRRYGLPADGGDGARYPASVREVTRSLRHLPLSTGPRTTWTYCNLGYLVLSHAVETLTGGRWLGDVLRDWLWTPLGMHATFLSLDDARAAPETLAQGYYWAGGPSGSGYTPVPHMPLDEVSGAGGIISTVNDYAKWVRCWIDGPGGASTATTSRDGGPAASAAACGGIPFSSAGLGHILAPKIFTAQTAASPAPYDAPEAYASAWTTTSYRGHRFWAHSGGSNAYGAQVIFFPQDRYGLVLFGNTASTSNAAELVLLWHLVADRFDVPPADRYDWDGRLRRRHAAQAARLVTAMDRLYPARATPPVPPSLPLDAYVGTFHHPAYQNITLRRAPDAYESQTGHPGYDVAFTAERTEHTWPTLCELVHVSGDHFALFTDMLYERSGHFRGYGRTHFRVGPDGRADALIVEFWDRSDDSVEGVFTFDRIDD